MNELKLIDFVGEAWWFILLVLSAGWYANYIRVESLEIEERILFSSKGAT